MLGSAWDAFQRSFVKGKASEGLRDFVQTITDLISKANKLFEDGIQIGDVGELKSGAKVVGGAGIFSALFAGMDIYSANVNI